MPGVRVVTDSASDLPSAIADELAIEMVPLTFRFGGEEYVDRRDLTSEQFWAKCDQSPTLPETAAPSPGAFEETFRSLAAQGADGIVCINLSSKLSATGQAAELAAEAVADTIPVRVIDSLNVSLGEGQIVIAAARLAAEGKGIEDVAGLAEDLIPRMRLYASLDTLENLKKGGRIGGAKAMLATMLSFKPVIAVVHGAVEEEAKPRTRSRSLAHLVQKVKEAVAAARLAHPNVVATFDAATRDDDEPFIVMELVRGRSLRRALSDDGPMDPDRAVTIVLQVAAALGHAHANGLVHRDIKPGNILLCEEGPAGPSAGGASWVQAKVADFGIAKAMAQPPGDATQTGSVLGTAKYLAPEVVEGGEPDARSDI